MPGGRRGGDTKGMVSERRVAKVIRIMDAHGQPLGAKTLSEMFNNRCRKGQFTSREMSNLLSRRRRFFSSNNPRPGKVKTYVVTDEALRWEKEVSR